LIPLDRRKDGELVPSYDVATRELAAAAIAMKDAGGGLFQIVPELGLAGSTPADDFAVLLEVSEASGQPITFTVMEGRQQPGHSRRMLEMAHEHNANGGAPMHAQFLPRPLGMMASFDLTSNPFLYCPTYQQLLALPLAERIAELRKPEVKARIISEEPGEALLPLTTLSRQFDIMFELGDPPCYEPAPGTSVAERARAEGRSPEDLAYDLLLEDEGQQMVLVALGNLIDESMDAVIPYFEDEYSVIGLGDGGAHYGLICDASYPTYVLSHWARDRKGWRAPLEKAVQAMTETPARVIGLEDRGTIAPGMKADMNVIDHEKVTLCRPFPVDDLPAGGRRLNQSASGYRATYVSGVAIQRDDTPTAALPGRLVRRHQPPQFDK
ncbi:MAG: amidohydrolase family protein, partial [Novosphingobium sp.]|nr:amidohydrolase family protein [Novosphingobium sp.]